MTSRSIYFSYPDCRHVLHFRVIDVSVTIAIAVTIAFAIAVAFTIAVAFAIAIAVFRFCYVTCISSLCR